MAKEKNKPVPVRFDLKLLEILKEEEKIDTPQQALNFLSKFWENNRPAKEDFEMKDPVVVVAVTTAAAGEKRSGSEKKSGAVTKAGASEVAAGEAKAPPAGLSGIDLSIWKAEQKEKEKKI